MGQGEATPQYQIVIAPRVARNLGRLDRRMMERVSRRIDALVQQPYLGKPLKGRLKDKRSLRVGDFLVKNLIPCAAPKIIATLRPAIAPEMILS